ncbi:MAG TPA: fatty acid desaturase family protein [Kofleriaceae bacterium]|nr:fatty acid desaturase family protein [Kofleriaceae bacterium]
MSTGAADILTREEIRSFTQRSNFVGAIAIAWSWLVIIGCFVAVALVPHPAVFVGAVILLGGRQLALAVAMHEAAHGTLFKSRWANEVLTDWLCARPVWSDTARYRVHHLQHHAHTGTDRDPDLGLALAEPMSRRSLRRKLLRDIFGASGVRRVVGLLAIDAELLEFDVGGSPRRAKFRSRGYHLRALAKNIWKPILANLVMFGALYAAGVAWVYLAWVVAYLTMFSLVIRVRSLAEHACTARTDDQLLNTRTTRANLAARMTLAPLHVNYHLEHHLLPTVPWWRLPALHRALVERGALPSQSLARGYLHVLQLVSR